MKTTKLFLIPITIFIFNTCTNKNNKRITDNYKPLVSESMVMNALEKAYKLDNKDSFDIVFREWNKSVKQNSAEYINQNNAYKAVFNSFRAFYKPLDLLKLGKWEWGNGLNADCKYIVVQNIICYHVFPTDDLESIKREKIKFDVIDNFRPIVDIDPLKVLYLTSVYDTALNKFLGNKSSQAGEKNIMTPSQAIGESGNRYEKIRYFIPVLHGHWGSYWHLTTHPVVGEIALNKSFTKARYYFRVGYQGGEAFLEKKGDSWEIIESRATWIE